MLLIVTSVMSLTSQLLSETKKGGNIVYCWVCGEDGGKKDPLYGM